MSGHQEGVVHYRDIVNSIQKSIVIVDKDFTVLFANLMYYQMFGDDEADVVQHSLFEVSNNLWDREDFRTLLKSVLEHSVSVQDYTLTRDFPIVGERTFTVAMTRLFRDGAGRDQIVITCSDITKAILDSRSKDEQIDHANAMILEVQHRVKNNLAAIRSMLRLESRGLEDPRALEVMQRVGMRVENMTSLYELLAISSHTGNIALLPYLSRICTSVERMSGAEVLGWSISITGEPVEVDIDKAIAIGTVVNELVVNAAKYAFPAANPKGRIVVHCEPAGDVLRITVADNGSGMKTDGTQPKSTGLGMRLVNMYLSNIGGSLTTDSDSGGTSCRLTIPYPENPRGHAAAATPMKLEAAAVAGGPAPSAEPPLTAAPIPAPVGLADLQVG